MLDAEGAVPVADTEPAQVAEAPAPAPAAPSPATAEAPAPTPAPVAPTTVLGDALAPDPAPVEAAPAEPPVAPETVEGQSADPAPLPTYEPFTLPEGVTLEAERVGEFTGLLGEFEGKTAADHAAVQEFGQKLMDRHVAEVQRAVTTLQQQQATAWEAQKAEWKDAFVADPNIGGNRMQTTIDAARRAIRTHGGDEAQQAEFRSIMESSGLGNHPVMIGMLARIGGTMSEARPLAATQPRPTPKSNTEKMYGGSRA